LFVPMTADAYLVVVAPDGADGRPALERAVAFAARGDPGVIYHAGIWHHPIAALERPADFLMAMWETGTAADTEVRRLDRPVGVHR
jgi:ureidoglycolate lyase